MIAFKNVDDYTIKKIKKLDNYSLEEDAEYKSSIVSFDDFKKPTEKWTAIFAGRSEVVFMTFDTEEDALLTPKELCLLFKGLS